MQSSEWTPERLQGRIQDHLRWVAAVDAAGAATTSTPSPKAPFKPWPWFKSVLRRSVSAVPIVGPPTLTLLRGVKARVRRGLSSQGR